METKNKDFSLCKIMETVQMDTLDGNIYMMVYAGSLMYYKAGYCYLTGHGRVFDKFATEVLDTATYKTLVNNYLDGTDYIDQEVVEEIKAHHVLVLEDKPVLPNTLKQILPQPTKTNTTLNRDTLATEALYILLATLPEVSPEYVQQATKLAYITADAMLGYSKVSSKDLDLTTKEDKRAKDYQENKEQVKAKHWWLELEDSERPTYLKHYKLELEAETENLTLDNIVYMYRSLGSLVTSTKATLNSKKSKLQARNWWNSLAYDEQEKIAEFYNLDCAEIKHKDIVYLYGKRDFLKPDKEDTTTSNLIDPTKILKLVTQAAKVYTEGAPLDIKLFIQDMYISILGKKVEQQAREELANLVNDLHEQFSSNGGTLDIELYRDYSTLGHRKHPYYNNGEVQQLYKEMDKALESATPKEDKELLDKATKWWSSLPTTVQTRIARYYKLYREEHKSVRNSNIATMFTEYSKIKGFLLPQHHTLLALNWWDMLTDGGREYYFTENNLIAPVLESDIKAMYNKYPTLAPPPKGDKVEYQGWAALTIFRDSDKDLVDYVFYGWDAAGNFGYSYDLPSVGNRLSDKPLDLVETYAKSNTVLTTTEPIAGIDKTMYNTHITKYSSGKSTWKIEGKVQEDLLEAIPDEYIVEVLPVPEPKEVVGYLTLDEFKLNIQTSYYLGNSHTTGLSLDSLSRDITLCSSYQDIKQNGCSKDMGYTGNTVILKVVRLEDALVPSKIISYGVVPLAFTNFCKTDGIELEEAAYTYSLDGVKSTVFIPSFKDSIYPRQVDANSLYITGERLYTLKECEELVKGKGRYCIYRYDSTSPYENNLEIIEQTK